MWSVPLLLGRITQMLSREETHVDASSLHCRHGCCQLIEEHKHLFGFLSSQELQDYTQSQFKWMFVIKILKTNVSKHFPLKIEWYQGSCGLMGTGYKHRKNCENWQGASRDSFFSKFKISGLKISVFGLKISISGLKISISGLKISINGLKISINGLKISISGLKKTFMFQNKSNLTKSQQQGIRMLFSRWMCFKTPRILSNQV